MVIKLTPNNTVKDNCLILVGGSGDPIEKFQPLANSVSDVLPEHTIVTFTFSQVSTDNNLLDLQTLELYEVLDTIKKQYSFKRIDLWCTSMGSYSTIKALTNYNYSSMFTHVILYDPADYYLSAKFEDSSDVTWSGSQQYLPDGTVISDELAKLKGDYKINIVHLTLRNYSPKGYIDSNYSDRGHDHQNGCPRLSTDMIKAMFSKIPAKNRGKYVEESSVPHGFLRDGNIQENTKKVSTTIIDIIMK